MSEDDNPLKEAIKTFAGLGGKEEIEEVRSQDPEDAGLRDVGVPEETVPSAQAVEEDGVINRSSAEVSRRRQEE